MFMDAIMTEKICRICLCTNKTLFKLDKNLSDYIIHICDNNTRGSTKHLCCLTCKESLKNNLDFRNKCCQSNQILQEWENDQSQEKLPIESLHTLLRVPNTEYDYEIIKNEDGVDNEDEIKIEIHESYSEDYDVTDTNDIYSAVSTVNCKNVKTKRPKRVKSKSGPKIDKQAPRKYKLRGEITKRTEFTQFEAVFEIALFATYAEARKELLGRQTSEPYLSAQYRCELCYTVFKNGGQLQFHKKWHDLSAGLSHECDVCSMRFATRSTLLKHKPNCHRGKFACKMCPLVTYQLQAMKAHFQKHQGKTYKCHCDRVFKHISSYMTHRRVVHASSHVCVTCARTFVSQLGLRNHRLKMHPAECKSDSEGTVRCEPCGLTFASEQVYTVHVLNTDSHKDIANSLVACSVCGLTFEDTTQLKEHRRENHARAPNPLYKRIVINNPLRKNSPKKKEKIADFVECKLCGLSGTSQAWLYQHYRRSHPASRYEAPRGQREYLCEQCGQGFYKKLQLEEHKYVHSGLKPFRCETCHKAFRTKMSLKNHSERHAPPSRECMHCGKKFNSAANLSNHIRVHTGDRRFVCAYCGKGFLHRAAQREHTRGVHLHIRRERRTNK